MAPTDPRILALHKAAWDFAETWHAEDEAMIAVRARAAEVGCQTVSPGAGAALRLLASVAGATAAVEVGTGAGISAVRMLQGMAGEGVVTSVDAEAEHQVLARDLLATAGVHPSRVRMINGRAAEVLGRLTDGAYDIVLLATHALETHAYIDDAHRLLRNGGMLIVNRALAGDRLADPAARDADTMAIRALVADLHDDERFTSALLPLGGGLLVASKRTPL